MPTDDRQIIITGQAPAPASWKVPGNGQVRPLSVFAHYDGTAATTAFVPALKVISDGMETVGIYPLPTSLAAGASADVSWFPSGGLDIDNAQTGTGVIVEQHFTKASAGTPTIFTTSLQSSRAYIVTVQGTYTNQNALLTVGTPNADAMFPTTEPGRVTTQVGTDADCTFAAVAGQPLGHNGSFRMSLDGGATFTHIEPVGGPFATPQTNYFYTFNVTGQGHPLQVQIFDSVYTDNYGELLVTLQTVGGSSGGGGGGSLLPDPTQQPNGAWLRTSSGVAVWSATPQVAETDMTLSDVTTQNVSTTKHGFAPKAPNDATKFLDGTGVYSAPSGSAVLTTKGDLFTFTTVNAREPVGSNGQVLIADSAQTTGIRWGAVPAGSGGAVTQICQSILGGSQATFDTNTILGGNIPGSYNHLKIVLYSRLDDAAANEFVNLQFNADNGANYDWVQLVGNAAGGGAIGTGAVAQTAISLGRAPGSTATANRFGALEVQIPMYAGTTGDKVLTAANHESQSTATAGITMEVNGGTWRNTAAVTRITLLDSGGGNFVAGSAFFLYGVT